MGCPPPPTRRRGRAGGGASARRAGWRRAPPGSRRGAGGTSSPGPRARVHLHEGDLVEVGPGHGAGGAELGPGPELPVSKLLVILPDGDVRVLGAARHDEVGALPPL